MWKKVGLSALIVLLLIASAGMIGWIGFQEKIRLAVKALQAEQLLPKESEQDRTTTTNPQFVDHSIVETKAEADEVVKHLEGVLRTLEEDNVPTE